MNGFKNFATKTLIISGVVGGACGQIVRVNAKQNNDDFAMTAGTALLCVGFLYVGLAMGLNITIEDKDNQ